METYNGHVRAPADAIILFEACRLGLLPRVQRRLSEKERSSIKSGSVFVWDEREAGMRRWTDGKSWSASRVSGSFLTYREMEGKRGGGGFAPPLAAAAAARAGKTPESTRGSDSDVELPQEEGPDGYRYKPDGLMKQSFSITTSSGNHLHLISYYSRTHPNAQALNNPTSDPALRHIRPQKGMYPESTAQEQQNIPAVTRAPMASAPYSTVPQMAGYARGPPGPPPRDYAPAGYAWAPQPPIVSPQIPYGYHYPQTQPPTNGHSPLSYPHHLPSGHSQGPPGPPPSHYDHPPAPRPDYRPPPPLHHRTSSSGNGMSQYPQHNSPQLSHPPVSHSPTSHAPAHPQQVVAQAQHRPPSSTPPLCKIDPRLMVPSPLAQQPSHPSTHSRSPSPMPPRQESSNSTPTQVTGASSIPSIGSLMNGANGNNGEAQSESVNRSASRSPGGTRKAEGPKDIPGDKMGFVEDKRALRVLDRAFRT
ncbi:MAG: hypothetical protein L6R37_005434 [Teloschistes peruensis]|nr:MAG: hypothetical protein L6R37_005434 [Teloschistes peruensis]